MTWTFGAFAVAVLAIVTGYCWFLYVQSRTFDPKTGAILEREGDARVMHGKAWIAKDEVPTALKYGWQPSEMAHGVIGTGGKVEVWRDCPACVATPASAGNVSGQCLSCWLRDPAIFPAEA